MNTNKTLSRTMVAGKHKLLVGDSLVRRLPKDAICNAHIISRPGGRCLTLLDEIKAAKLDITGYSVIGLLIGTNDIDNVVYSQFGPVGYKLSCKNHHAPDKPVTLSQVQQNFSLLLSHMLHKNPTAVVVVFAVIPRLGDWDWSKAFTFQFNQFLESQCCIYQSKGVRVIFAPSYKFFTYKGLPQSCYYGWDGIHLSDRGLSRIKQCAQQAMSTKNVVRGGVWKRSRQVCQQGRERIRARRGNVIVFSPQPQD